MDNKFKHMQLEMINNHLSKVAICKRPATGWLRAIRTAIGINTRQMAERLGIRQQSVLSLEKSEIHDSITLKSLRKAAEALDCHLVYAIIPNDKSLHRIIEKQALKKAQKLLTAVEHTMMLEAQNIENGDDKIKKLAEELAKSFDSTLWD
jgi:predicted DNA-binding mobile mystery protein A